MTAFASLLFLGACRPSLVKQPSIHFSRVPIDAGGPETLEPIQGIAHNAPGDHVILYSYSFDQGWLQPFVSHAFTYLAADSTWQNSTHLAGAG